jgi:hypothetical protein
MLAVAKCGGPQIEFQPGRVDSLVADAPMRLPNPVAPLAHTVGPCCGCCLWESSPHAATLLTVNGSCIMCAWMRIFSSDLSLGVCPLLLMLVLLLLLLLFQISYFWSNGLTNFGEGPGY